MNNTTTTAKGQFAAILTAAAAKQGEALVLVMEEKLIPALQWAESKLQSYSKRAMKLVDGDIRVQFVWSQRVDTAKLHFSIGYNSKKLIVKLTSKEEVFINAVKATAKVEEPTEEF